MTTTVKLSQLIPDMKCNSRRDHVDNAMRELIESIAHNGLILPIAVRPLDDGHYLIIDGHRRFEALTRLHAERMEETDVPVLVRDVDDKDARALSLAANIVRLPLHPADQYVAFAKMLDEGMAREEIAARFSLDLKAVGRVLALGKVIPAALQMYREGEIDVETVRLFASCSEERQLAVWRKAYEENKLSRWQVQRLLSDDTIEAHSSVAKLVGDAYEAAGGRVEQCLFGNDARWLDTELALSLAKQKIGELKEQLHTEGWSFVHLEHDLPKQWRGWMREYETRIFTPEQAADLAEISDRLAAMTEVEEWTDELEEEQAMLEDRAQEIQQSAPRAFSAEQKASSGVVLCEDYTVVYGVKWPVKVVKPEASDEPQVEDKAWPQSLVQDLYAAATDAIQIGVAQGGMIQHMAFITASILASHYDKPSTLSAHGGFHYGTDKKTAVEQGIEAQLENMKIKQTKDFWPIYKALIESKADDLQTLFGLAVASTITTRRKPEEYKRFTEAFPGCDIDAVWQPDEAFFKRLNVAQLNEVAGEMRERRYAEHLKKKEIVELIAPKAKAKGWLPKILAKLRKPAADNVVEVKPQKRKKAA